MTDQQKPETFTVKGQGGQSKTSESSTVRAQTGSQEFTVSPTLSLLAYVRPTDELMSTSMEFHMTIRPKVSNLSPKAASMLGSICVVRAMEIGIDFTLYLCLEFLRNTLNRADRDPLYNANDKIRKTVMLMDVVLAYARGTWQTLDEYTQLPDEILEKLDQSPWLPNNRTLQSWKQHWDLEKYLQVRIVPVDSLINRDKSSNAEPYSGYTRGYGNDGKPPAPGRTRPSAELDGIEGNPDLPQLSLQDFEEYNRIVSLIESAKAAKRQRR